MSRITPDQAAVVRAKAYHVAIKRDWPDAFFLLGRREDCEQAGHRLRGKDPPSLTTESGFRLSRATPTLKPERARRTQFIAITMTRTIGPFALQTDPCTHSGQSNFQKGSRTTRFVKQRPSEPSQRMVPLDANLGVPASCIRVQVCTEVR